jgi:hypothetical protein
MRATPASADAARFRRPSTAPAAPASDRTSPKRTSRPPFPDEYGSATIPIRFFIRSNIPSSPATPSSASARAGPCCSTGAPTRPSPPAAVAADPANTYGISRCPSCQAGTAVSAISAAV